MDAYLAYLQSVSTYEQDDSQSFVFGGVHIRKADDFFGRLNTQVFAEEPNMSAGFKLLTKQY